MFCCETGIEAVNSHVALYKLRNGSPRLRHVIRKRCQERCREGRDNVVNQRRLLQEYKEVSNLKHLETASVPKYNGDANVDTLETELLTYEEELILKQCETYLTDEEMFACIASESLDYKVICPICMRNNMMIGGSEQDHMIHCDKCGTTLDCSQSLQEFGELLSSHVISHNDKCSSCLSFFVLLEDDRRRLGILCTLCNFYNVI